ncbi:MucR family transcriptional regulator, partial [Sinorhizobium meliloti]|nr:MucR family transcriptional regulator [Sinorhizobium meliloti]
MTESHSNELRLELTSRIVSAYLSRNVIAPS